MEILVIYKNNPTQISAVRSADPVQVAISYRGIPGVPGLSGAGYVHEQSVAASTWTINHNLGFRPSAELFTTGGSEFEAEVINTTINQTIVYLLTARAGSARLT